MTPPWPRPLSEAAAGVIEWEVFKFWQIHELWMEGPTDTWTDRWIDRQRDIVEDDSLKAWQRTL